MFPVVALAYVFHMQPGRPVRCWHCPLVHFSRVFVRSFVKKKNHQQLESRDISRLRLYPHPPPTPDPQYHLILPIPLHHNLFLIGF